MRRRHDRYLVTAWLARWEFAAVVGVTAAVALVVGATAAVPADMPGVALEAAAVYRLEVGGAIFIGVYLVAVAFVLSLRNRGFTDIGSNGVRAQDLDTMPGLVSANEVSLELLSEIVEDVKRLQVHRGEE